MHVVLIAVRQPLEVLEELRALLLLPAIGALVLPDPKEPVLQDVPSDRYSGLIMSGLLPIAARGSWPTGYGTRALWDWVEG